MKAVGYHHNLPLSDPQALLDLELPEPVPGAQDLLVEVRAVSVNPVDTKVRKGVAPAEGQAKVLGWDAAGVVRAVGAEVAGFQPGDRVWYAGALTRPGSNSALHAVDARIASRMPASLGFEQAAALPLTTITAWELLFERLGVAHGGGEGQQLLVVGAAGGVGSILVQLARQLTRLEVIATASRPETVEWTRAMGAHQVIDHRHNLAQELARIGRPQVALVAALTQTERHFPALAEALAPQGRLALIDDPATPLDIGLLKRKSISLHWEFMFTRSMFETPDIAEQGKLLARVASLVDEGRLRSTMTRSFGTMNAENLKAAHAWVESGSAIGKAVLAGF
ncbi:MAG TPA: zinc-binding alcohol dehydrogenase family protein [Ideonella sp.]|nr:zinc-binding alcohol dehydrogenase family protein [Ideonella sp.]